MENANHDDVHIDKELPIAKLAHKTVHNKPLGKVNVSIM
jgi:hypothetical protein